jgi:endonuclease/exonuclease/phosphatase family metal-dependent hydrolase
VYWINKRSKPEDVVIMMGDFNALPDNDTVNWILGEGGFKSTLREFHGEEPEKTFNTGLVSPYVDEDPPCTVDYIFYRTGRQQSTAPIFIPRVRIIQAKVMGERHDPEDNTLYGSDHYPLMAEFEIGDIRSF